MASMNKIELLEPRRLFNTADLSGSVLTILGNSQSNKITVGETNGAITVDFGGKPSGNSPFTGVKSIVIKGNDGNDTITVESTVASGINLNVSGGNGNDSITLDGGHGSVAGGAGADHIAIDDAVYDANGGLGKDTITAAGGANEILHGGDGADSIGVTGGGYDLVYGGSGGNTFDIVGGYDTVISGSGHDNVTADGGADALLFDMSGGDTVTGNVDSLLGADTIYTAGHHDSITEGPNDVTNPDGKTHPPKAAKLLAYLEALTDPSQLPPTI